MSRKAKTNSSDEMRAEYDFSKGVRGKYFERYQSGPVTVVVKRAGSAHQGPNRDQGEPPSAEAISSARHLVGGLPYRAPGESEERVMRLAKKLETLVQLERGASTASFKRKGTRGGQAG